MLDSGETTRGLTVTARGGHLIAGRTDEYGGDPRFRLTPLGGGAYGLSLYRRKRWDPCPSKVRSNNSRTPWTTTSPPGPTTGP